MVPVEVPESVPVVAVCEATDVVNWIVYEPRSKCKTSSASGYCGRSSDMEHVRVRCWTSDSLDRESGRYLLSHRFCAITNSKLGEIYCLSAKTVPAGVWIAKSEELGLPLP